MNKILEILRLCGEREKVDKKILEELKNVTEKLSEKNEKLLLSQNKKQ